MNAKPLKYALHIRGRGELGPIAYDLDNLNCMPTFQVGNYVQLRDFDYQYENTDRAIVREVVWGVLNGDSQTVIHQYVTILEETIDEQAQRSKRNKELGL